MVNVIMKGPVTYDPYVIRGAATVAANESRARIDAEELYRSTYSKRMAAPRKITKTAKKAKKKVKKRKRGGGRSSGGGGVGGFLRGLKFNIPDAGDFNVGGGFDY